MRRIDLLYDIAVLGMAQVDSRARTGVYRVVENIAVGVAQSDVIEVKFFSSIGNNIECRDYLRQHNILASHEQRFMPDITTALGKPRGIKWFWSRLVGEGAGSVSTSIIYHSPFHPMPNTIRTMRGVSKVLTVHDLIAIKFPEYFRNGGDLPMKEILESITPDTTVLCNSESTKNDLCSYLNSVDPNRVYVTPLAASSLFHPCREPEKIASVRLKYGIPADVRYLLSVCTLEPRKNIELVIRSFVKLALEENLPDLCLVLTGTKGWKYDEIFTQVEHAVDLKERILLTGYVNDEDLSPLYSGATAFVYPSFYEGFGLPPLEAMQCGTPVITSNTSSLSEVVGDAGIMVDPHDGDTLFRAMRDICNDDYLREELAHKAVEQASLFSWDRCVAQTIEAYRSSVSR